MLESTDQKNSEYGLISRSDNKNFEQTYNVAFVSFILILKIVLKVGFS